jgi:YtkA-like
MVKAALLLILAVSSSPALAQRAQADMRCTHTGTDFVYECVVHVKRAGEPVSGLSITAGADMPSMPMAHNVKPVKARPGKAPGEYLFMLDLDMAGEWAVKLRLSGALRDVVVVRYTFTETATLPRK